MPCKHTDLGAIQVWECSRGQQPDEPRCSVKEGDVRCERPARHRCAHPIKPRRRRGKLPQRCGPRNDFDGCQHFDIGYGPGRLTAQPKTWNCSIYAPVGTGHQSSLGRFLSGEEYRSPRRPVWCPLEAWQTRCERLLCDEHQVVRGGIVCPFHGGAK